MGTVEKMCFSNMSSGNRADTIWKEVLEFIKVICLDAKPHPGCNGEYTSLFVFFILGSGIPICKPSIAGFHIPSYAVLRGPSP